MSTTATAPRRWDGRSWLVRVLGASLGAVLATAVVDDTSLVLQVAAVTALVWVPAISVTERLRLRWPGPIPIAASTATDLAMAWVLCLLAPPLTPVLLVAVLPSALVHVVDLPQVWRWALGVAIVVFQLTAGSAVSGAVGAEIVVADVATGLAAVLLLGHAERDRRRTKVALDQMGELTDAVLAGIGEAVVVTDTGGRIRSANVAAETTFGQPVSGLCSTALALGKGAGDLDCSRGCPLLGPDGTASQVDVERQHPSGRRQALLVNVRALRDPLGRVREVVHSYRDVTKLKQADEAKTLFLATASHELKTPLAVIGGFAGLLAADRIQDEETRQHALSTIVARVEQLSTIVERLLLASKIDGGGVRLVTGPTDLRAIATERVDALRSVTERDITLDAPDELPLVESETIALATVIDHLVENAVKYSPEGGPVQVTVGIDDLHVVVDVADEGVGMTAEDAQQCLQPFWQAEATDTRRFGGSGIGLYIVDSLVQAMGGAVSIPRAIPGEGATFRFTVPRADVDPHAPTPTDPGRNRETVVGDLARQMGVV